MHTLRLCLLPLCLALLTACAAEPDNINLGQAAPTFEATSLAGTPMRFPADAAGKPLVIRFWADWCRFCEPEMREMEPIYQDKKTQGLEIYAINAGQDRATVEAFARKLGISYPVLLDEDAQVAKRYGVVGLPTTYFIDRNGVVRGKLLGEMSREVFLRQVTGLLEAQP